MPLNSEVLKHRFWRYIEKSGPLLCYQWQMPTTFGQVLGDFFALFLKNVQISYSGRLRAPAVHGVSSFTVPVRRILSIIVLNNVVFETQKTT